MNVQQGCPGFIDAGPERLLDIGEIVQTLRVIKIDNQMRTSAADPLSFDEVVQAVIGFHRVDRVRIYVFLLGGASWLGSVHDAFFNQSLQVHPQLEEGERFPLRSPQPADETGSKPEPRTYAFSKQDSMIDFIELIKPANKLSVLGGLCDD